MPVLTARAFSEMLHLPGYEQQRILVEQKYPRQGPSPFKIPYYVSALSQLRTYFATNHDRASLDTWIVEEAPALKPQSKAINNARLVSSFLASHFADRMLIPARFQKHFRGNPNPNVELKLSFDLVGSEGGTDRFVFVNPRSIAIDQQVAEETLQIGFWILSQRLPGVEISSLEYWDIPSDARYVVSKIAKRVITNMHNNAALVDAIWNSL